MAGGNFGSGFPIQAPAGAGELLLGEVNRAWGLIGAGSVDFWQVFGFAIYRDTVAGDGFTPDAGAFESDQLAVSTLGRLRFPNGYYKLMASEGITFDYMGDTEKRNLESMVGKILVGPARGERVDGPAVPLDAVSPTADPGGDIELAVRQTFRKWAELQPLVLMTNVLVNGRVSIKKDAAGNYKHELLKPYTLGTALIATNHKVNPLNAASKTFPNLIQLPGSINETGWGEIEDTIRGVPDLDGTSLPNAFSTEVPEIMVGTKAQWIRWAHVLGGPNVPAALLQLAPTGNAAVHSVLVGAARLTLNPYLKALNDPANTVPINKRSFVFPKGGRYPFIFREELPPFARDTGRMGAPAHTHNTRVLYIQARNTMIPGEPRSVFEVQEK